MRNKRRTDEEWLSLIQQCRSSGFSDQNPPITEPARQELALSLQQLCQFLPIPPSRLSSSQSPGIL